MYQISCQECGGRSKKSEYTGETSRTAYLRGREHLEGLAEEKEDNPLWKHCLSDHGGEKVGFRMKVLRGHRSPLTRQIHEAVQIQYSTADVVMNSKGEWNGARIPRVVIEVGKDIQDEEEETGKEKPHKREIQKERNQGRNWDWTKENLLKRKGNHEEQGPAKRKRQNNNEKISGCGTTHVGCGNTKESGCTMEKIKTLEPECGKTEMKKSECGTAQPKPGCGNGEKAGCDNEGDNRNESTLEPGCGTFQSELGCDTEVTEERGCGKAQPPIQEGAGSFCNIECGPSGTAENSLPDLVLDETDNVWLCQALKDTECGPAHTKMNVQAKLYKCAGWEKSYAKLNTNEVGCGKRKMMDSASTEKKRKKMSTRRPGSRLTDDDFETDTATKPGTSFKLQKQGVNNERKCFKIKRKLKNWEEPRNRKIDEFFKLSQKPENTPLVELGRELKMPGIDIVMGGGEALAGQKRGWGTEDGVNTESESNNLC